MIPPDTQDEVEIMLIKCMAWSEQCENSDTAAAASVAGQPIQNFN